ncbi:MAG: transposase [Balneolaceae bacterium]|nr:transposase [Balneolaceae bacterium]
MEPEISIEAYWTSLDWAPEDIQAFYQQRGTSEQFHSELKTDLDLERLPSGKFQTNQHILDLGMIAYNILRLLGQQMLATGQVPGRKAESARLRLRTVLNSLIYMAGRPGPACPPADPADLRRPRLGRCGLRAGPRPVAGPAAAPASTYWPVCPVPARTACLS